MPAPLDPNNMPVGEFLDQWLADKPVEFLNYVKRYTRILIDKKLAVMTAGEMVSFVEDLRAGVRHHADE